MILDDILAYKKLEIEELKRNGNFAAPPPLPRAQRRNFAAALRSPAEVRLIAEIKRRSPSRGDIRADLDAAQMALTYQRGGAAALSVLADEKFFGGSLTDLFKAREAVALPALRKDFILDKAQIWQSVSEDGPDAILLIVAALSEDLLKELLQEAARYGLACLVEAHTEEEVDIALQAGAEIIGINNRDLKTFVVDLKTTERLRKRIPEGKIIVSESGIHSRQDVLRLRDIGVNAMLVGEAILQSPNPAAKIAELLGH